MRSFNRIVLAFALCTLLAVPALAQNPTGTLAGRVTDAKDALPGVAVTLTSPSLQGTRTTRPSRVMDPPSTPPTTRSR